MKQREKAAIEKGLTYFVFYYIERHIQTQNSHF